MGCYLECSTKENCYLKNPTKKNCYMEGTSKCCQFLYLKSNYFDHFPAWLGGALIWQFLFKKSDYFDNFPASLGGARNLAISLFTK